MPAGRRVTLLLCTPDGLPLGTLPPVDVARPYWQEVGDVVAAARAAFGIDVTVLRLVRATAARTEDGGPVTYLAEAADARPARRALSAAGADDSPDVLADHPRRAPYARPGGPARDLAWARGRLADAGRPVTGVPQQVRTWNLSSIWRLPTAAGPVWLKVVPPFLARESAILAVLPPSLRPPVLAAEGPRVLLDHVPGDDQYGADSARVLELAGVLARLQEHGVDRTAEILAAGGVDRRPAAVLPPIHAVVGRHRAALPPDAAARLDALVDGLGPRLDDVASCGLPDTLVHGDFHPGNLRGRPGSFVALDWAEAGVGNPALDVLALTAGLPDAGRRAVVDLVAGRRPAPAAELARAVELLRPVVPLLGAVTYQGFLDAIEPDEHPYHAADPRNCLLAAVAETAGSGA